MTNWSDFMSHQSYLLTSPITCVLVILTVNAWWTLIGQLHHLITSLWHADLCLVCQWCCKTTMKHKKEVNGYFWPLHLPKQVWPHQAACQNDCLSLWASDAREYKYVWQWPRDVAHKRPVNLSCSSGGWSFRLRSVIPRWSCVIAVPRSRHTLTGRLIRTRAASRVRTRTRGGAAGDVEPTCL